MQNSLLTDTMHKLHFLTLSRQQKQMKPELAHKKRPASHTETALFPGLFADSDA